MGRNKNNKEKFNKKIFPLLLIMVVPLVMFAQNVVYDNKLTNPYLILQDSYLDLFNFYKSIALYIITIMSVVFYFLYTKKRDMKLSKDKIKYYIPLLVYTIFIILSTIFSVYPKIAIFGVYERFEGALALLSYLLILVYTIEVIRSEMDITLILKAFLIMNFVIAAIGLLQNLKLDPFETRIVQFMIGLPKGIDIVTKFDNSTYSTLYNPNNAGQFSTLVFPVALLLVFALKETKWKIFSGITSLLLLIMVFGSGSDNAIVGMFVSMLVLAFIFFKNIIPHGKKRRIVFFSSIAAIFVAVCVLGVMFFDNIINLPSIQREIQAFNPEEDDMYLYDTIVNDDLVSFVTNNGTFHLAYLDSGMAMLDANMNPLAFRQDDRFITFTDEQYNKTISIEITSTNTVSVSFKRAPDRATIEVVFDEEKILGIRGTGGRILHDVMENQMPEKLQGLETTFSRRGYLWFVTMDRLDEVIFIGAGPDNFLYWFEQHDVIGKVNLNHRAQILADKPHNIFLQIASQTGIISLLAWLTLLGIYFVETFKAIGLRHKTNFSEFIAGGIISGIIGFLAASIFVDSSVGVSIIFYVLLGIGIYVIGIIPKKALTK